MKSRLSTLLIPFIAMLLTVSEGETVRCFSSGAFIQHGRPTPTPTPSTPGSIPPGDTGGAHRTSEHAGEATGTAPAAIAPAGNEGTLEFNRNFGIPMVPTMKYKRALRHRRARSTGLFSYLPTSETRFLQPCGPAEKLENELSGVYFGNLNFEGLKVHGAMLRICGSEFTLVQGGKEASGLVASVTTSGYTAAAFRFTEVRGFESHLLAVPKTVSVTVSHSRGSRSFRSAPGEPREFSFIESRERHARSKPLTRSRKL